MPHEGETVLNTGPLRSTLGPLKSNVTRHLDKVKNLLAADRPKDDADELQKHIEKLHVHHDNLNTATTKLQNKLDEWSQLLQTTEDLPTDEQDHFDRMSTDIINLNAEGDDLLGELNVGIHFCQSDLDRLVQAQQNKNDNATAPDQSQNVAGTSGSTANQQLGTISGVQSGPPVSNSVQTGPAPVPPPHTRAFKAPKLKLPTFSGDYKEFKQFWGIFQATIDDDPNMTNIEKFTYLLSVLEGDAKGAITGIVISDTNYDVAVDVLKSRFDHAEDRMVTLLYSELTRIPSCSRKTAEKQRTMDHCERIFRQLVTAGEDINSNKALVCTLLTKFPPGMIKDLQRYYGAGANSTLTEVRAQLQKYITEEETTSAVLDDLQGMKLTKQSDTGQSQQFQHQQRSPASGNNYRENNNRNSGGNDNYDYTRGRTFENSALAATNARSYKEKPKWRSQPQQRGAQYLTPTNPCYLCGEFHFNQDCKKYATADQRTVRLAVLKRCLRCMKLHNPNAACPAPIKCVYCGIDEDHTTALCKIKFPDGPPSTVDIKFATPTAAKPGDGQAKTTPGTTSGGITALNAEVKSALFQTAKTIAVNPKTGQQHTLRLAMDTLSSRSYITDEAAEKLGLTSNNADRLYVDVFGTNKSIVVQTSRVEFDVTFKDGTRHPIEANTTKIICKAGAVFTDWSDDEKKALSHFNSALADDPFDNDGKIDVLIGSSLVWEFIDGARCTTTAPRLYLIPSKFGLMLAGESDRTTPKPQPTMLCLTESPCQFPSELGVVSTNTKYETDYPDIDEFWELEKIGIKDDPIENDDDKALDAFKKTVSKDDDRYEVTWPWIDEKRDVLPSNYNIAYDRLRSLMKRLRTNPDLLQAYRDILTFQKERGIIEEVPENEIQTDHVTNYLPHHPVIKPSSNTTRIRIVYDAGAKQNRTSVSLNDCMFRGPVILPDLCQLLMRIRVHEIVVISDIEKAFLQVGLQPHDRDVTRFLWFKDDTKLTLQDNLAVLRFKRVNFGVISSPFLLAATIDHHLTMENTAFAEKLRHDIYVDNVISGLNAEDDPLKYYSDLKELFQHASMNIQEFCSNSATLMESIPEQDKVKLTDVKVLGLKWDSRADDTLRLVKSSKLLTDSAPTKRSVLRATASVFDPVGFYQPVMLPAKLFLQKLWDKKCGWDDSLSNDLKEEWNSLQASLHLIFEHRISRFIGKINEETTIAVFSDASMLAYAAAVYLRTRQGDKWTTRLIFSKTRLAPTSKRKQKKITGEKISLHRLELLGAVIGVRAAKFCRDGLQIPSAKVDIFIDSQCVLRWINSRGILKRFVANRVEEIRKLTNGEFHYVSTESNPADYATRGKLPEELLSNESWWNGPSWLASDRSEWPERVLPPITTDLLEQMQQEYRPAYFGHTLVAAEPGPPVNLFALDLNDISSLEKLLRISVTLSKFLKRTVWNKLSDTSRDRKPGLMAFFDNISDGTTMTATDYETVKRQWIKQVQRNHFPDVLTILQDEKAEVRCPQIIQQLGLQLDQDGLIRCHGRYENADLPSAAREPILLPKNDRFTLLVVENVHRKHMHSGVSHTLSQLRQEYWVPHGRALVRGVRQGCLLCRRYKTGKPYKLPPMPPWPKERVTRAAPFQTTGLDYFGPINVNVNGSKTKMWVCLFTCLTVRAVHLEPVMDCSVQEFLHCFIRFVSRRGVPKTVISDNAGQFQLVKLLGDKAWKRTPTDPNVTAYAANQGITWKFITELAPWQGGFYERLVGLVKSTLRTSIRQKLLSWADLVTLLAEAEAIVNSRPLTYVGEDIDSRLQVIRPCDFLTVQYSSVSDSPDGREVAPRDFGEAGKRLVSVWKQRCRTLERLWTNWYNEYLLSLRERRKVTHKAGRSDVDKLPLLNQVILLCDFDAPRGRWKLARIIKLIEGKDGHVRSAEIVLSNGYRLRRPLNHLVPLEVERDPVSDDSSQAVIPTAPTGPVATPADVDQPPVLDVNDQPPVMDDAGDDGFYGFSDDDIMRTINALQRLDGLDGGVSAASA